MIFATLLLALAGQAAFMDPPAPPPLAAPDSPAFEREKTAFERELHELCISKSGSAIIIADWAERRAEIVRHNADPEWRRLERLIAEAAYASPIEMKQLETSIRANAEFRANTERTMAESKIAILRKLSARDREIYARRSTLMLPTEAPKVCKAP